MSSNLEDHPVYRRIKSAGPKRILSLDGGGIRGALTIGYLEKIEQILRERYDNPNFVLADYFDLVGGTSTGAIIATFVALGKPVAEIKELYLDLGPKIFKKRRHPFNWGYFKYFLSAEFDHTVLEQELENQEDIKDLTLGSDKFKTGLAIFAKRADTYKTFVFHNHPKSKYYEYNSGILVKDLLRATSAAPSYFKPKEIEFDDGGKAVFIDGGVSMVNNPSLMLFLIATIKGYRYEWRKSKDHMLMISVGTGYRNKKFEGKEKSKLLGKRIIEWAPTLPDMFMKDATEQNQYLMQYFTNPRIPEVINTEVGDLSSDLITDNPLLDYCRYNISLSKPRLQNLGFTLKEQVFESLPKMEKGENAEVLYTIGERHAEKIVSGSHFPTGFDRVPPKPISQEAVKTIFASSFDELAKTYKKFRPVCARKAKVGEKILSIPSDGIETETIAKDGDYVVQNQTESEEQWVVKNDEFHEKYEPVGNPHGKEWAVYTRRENTSVRALEMTAQLLDVLHLQKYFYLMPVWDEPQYVTIGDFLVNPIGKDEVYRVARKEFLETYTQF